MIGSKAKMPFTPDERFVMRQVKGTAAKGGNAMENLRHLLATCLSKLIANEVAPSFSSSSSSAASSSRLFSLPQLLLSFRQSSLHILSLPSLDYISNHNDILASFSDTELDTLEVHGARCRSD